MATQSEIQQKVQNWSDDVDRQQAVVNGGPNQLVTLRDGRQLRTLSGLQQYAEDLIEDTVDDIVGNVPRGPWAAGTNYAVGNLVVYNGIVYAAVQAHVAGNDFNADANAGRWTVYQGLTPQSDFFKARDKLRAHAGYGAVLQHLMSELPTLRPSRELIRAIMSGTVTIVVCGDSITAGADYFYSNGWVQNFEDMLREQIPWITWKIINRSISGRNLDQLANLNYTSPGSFVFPEVLAGDTNQLWPNGSPVDGKAWLDYIRDDQPDIIILVHQENHSQLNVRPAMTAVYNYTQTWAKKPWFTVTSQFLPTNETVPIYGDAFKNANTQRQALADWWREFAMKRGFGLIDVNGVMRMLRDGVRRSHVPLYTERNFRDWGVAGKWFVDGGTVSDPVEVGNPGAPVSRMEMQGAMIRRKDIYARDVDFNADFTRGSADATARILSYRLTGANNLSGYSFQYVWANNVVQLYNNDQLVGGWDASPATGGQPNQASPLANVNLRVRAVGNLHRCWVRGKLVAEYYDDTDRCNLFAGEMLSGYGAGTGNMTGPQWSWAVEYPFAPQYYTNEDIFGDWGATYLVNPDSLGGDAIHHMGRLGPYLIFLPAVQAWIDQIKGLFDRTVILGTQKQAGAIEAPAGGAVQVVPDMDQTFTVGRETIVKVDLSFGYRAQHPLGQLQIFLDGGQIEEWYIPVGSDVMTRTCSFAVVPGTHTISLRWFAGESKIESGGGGYSRHLTVTLVPA